MLDGSDASTSKGKNIKIDDDNYEAPTLYLDISPNIPPDAQDPYDDEAILEYFVHKVPSNCSDMDFDTDDGWNSPSDRSPKGHW